MHRFGDFSNGLERGGPRRPFLRLTHGTPKRHGVVPIVPLWNRPHRRHGSVCRKRVAAVYSAAVCLSSNCPMWSDKVSFVWSAANAIVRNMLAVYYTMFPQIIRGKSSTPTPHFTRSRAVPSEKAMTVDSASRHSGTQKPDRRQPNEIA